MAACWNGTDRITSCGRGEDLWLFSTDHPHGASPWPVGVPMVTQRTGLSESAKIKMLGENDLRSLPTLAGVTASSRGEPTRAQTARGRLVTAKKMREPTTKGENA